MKTSKKTKIIFAVVFTLIIGNSISASSIYQFSLKDETQRADCAIVAGAGVKGNEPSPVFQARLDHAATLYRQEMTHTIILTGGYSPEQPYSDAAIARNYLLKQGIPVSQILIEEKSTVTRENLRYAKELMITHNLKDALLVSDPLHMKRLISMAEKIDITAYSSPTPTTRYRNFTSRSYFLLRESYYYSLWLISGLF